MPRARLPGGLGAGLRDDSEARGELSRSFKTPASEQCLRHANSSACGGSTTTTDRLGVGLPLPLPVEGSAVLPTVHLFLRA